MVTDSRREVYQNPGGRMELIILRQSLTEVAEIYWFYLLPTAYNQIWYSSDSVGFSCLLADLVMGLSLCLYILTKVFCLHSDWLWENRPQRLREEGRPNSIDSCSCPEWGFGWSHRSCGWFPCR